MVLCYLLGTRHSFYYLKFKCFYIPWKKVVLFQKLQKVLKLDQKLQKRFETFSSNLANGSKLVYLILYTISLTQHLFLWDFTETWLSKLLFKGYQCERKPVLGGSSEHPHFACLVHLPASVSWWSQDTLKTLCMLSLHLTLLIFKLMICNYLLPPIDMSSVKAGAVFYSSSYP